MAADGDVLWLAQGPISFEGLEFTGLARFDGQAWTHYLSRTTVHHLAIASDGTIWYIADDFELRRFGPYPDTALSRVTVN
jgi:hypothetical protein